MKKFIALFLGFCLALSPCQSGVKVGQDCLAPESHFQQEAYFPALTVPAEAAPSFLDNLASDLKVAIDEFALTFNPVRFIALHDNRTKTGALDWKKLGSRIVGVSLIYASMIFGPYGLAQFLISYHPSLILLPMIIAAMVFSNIAAHLFSSQIARHFKLATLHIDLPKLGEEGRIALSQGGLTPHFSKRKVEKLAKLIKEELGAPALTAEKRKTLGEGKNQFEVFVGKSGPHTEWGIMEKDLPKLAA